MNSLVNFILESGISLAFLALVYLLFLRRETFFRTNRIFLLASVFFSVVLPFLKIRIYNPQSYILGEVTVTPYRNLIEAVTVYGKDFSGSVENMVLSADLIIPAYFAGMAVFLIRFLVRLWQIILIIRRNEVKEINGIKFVSLGKNITPFSFMNYVFVSSAPEAQKNYNEMVVHEFEHVRQGHSIDVLVLEILAIFHWFNPAMWMLKRAVCENHEFLADKAVLDSGVHRGIYKKMLLARFVNNQFEMANNFNYSMIRNRIRMMSGMKSSRISVIRVLSGIVAAAALTVVFACEQKRSEKSSLPDPGEQMKIVFNGDTLRIEGDTGNLQKIGLMLSSGNFTISSDSLGSGFLLLCEKAAGQDVVEAGEDVFFEVDEMPRFPGGEAALRNYIAGSVSYPPAAREKGIQGKVFVSFIVAKDGSVKNVKVARGVDSDLDFEAVRVISRLPVWEPGKQKGQPVNVQYTLPINFVLR